jgi:hypothetical protein
MVFLTLALLNKLVKFRLKAKHIFFIIIFLKKKKIGIYRILDLHFTVKV